APIGTPAFEDRTLQAIVAGHQRLLDALVAFSSDSWDFAVQGANLLLRYCGSPRLLYWCRLLAPSPSLLATARAHDDAKMAAFERISRAGALPLSARRQVQLPIRLGGFGLVSTARVASAAYLGSVAATVGDVWDRFRGHSWMLGTEAALLALPWLAQAASARTDLLVSIPSAAVPPVSQFIARPHARLQQRLSEALAKQDFTVLLESFPVGSRERARLLACQGPLSSGWLSAIPGQSSGVNRKCLNSFAYRMATAVTLGLPFPLANLSSTCTCGAAIDALGDHFFLCHQATAERVFKHNTLLDVFKSILAEVGIPVVAEVPLRSLGITPPDSDPNSQRMDLFFTVDGEGILADVTVRHPCRPDNSTPHHRSVNRTNGRLPGGAVAASGEREKERKYGANCRQQGYTFIPLAAETFGC
ncbi:unnamed protein product, partial [Vitrella brassicaformis CCMP3155]